MEVINNILITLFGAVVGALLSVAIPIYMSFRRFNAGPKLTGEWKAVYQAVFQPGEPWVNEQVTMRFRFGKIFFRTTSNEMQDEIEGDA